MTNDAEKLSKDPRPDDAEDQAFFPSPYSLSQYTSPKTDFDGVQHTGAYTAGTANCSPATALWHPMHSAGLPATLYWRVSGQPNHRK